MLQQPLPLGLLLLHWDDAAGALATAEAQAHSTDRASPAKYREEYGFFVCDFYFSSPFSIWSWFFLPLCSSFLLATTDVIF